MLEAIGLAMAYEIVRILDANGREPLRANSTLKKQLLSGEAVKVTQGRSARGRFEGYTANAALTLYALDYLQWIDSGRKKQAKRIPIFALVKFIKDRGLKLRDKQTGRFSRQRVRLKGRDGSPAVSVNRLAFMIQNAIWRNGIKARPVIAPAFEFGQHLVDLYLDEQLLDGIAYDIEQQINLSYISTKK
ncbi:hypothetical protein Q5H92_21760 [Hymenobacter sp. M29]|uniref:Uncharacterized protein n=1 Tax=Hymenobacter mellowenesis TaxID=3063995 RepID=A0ABT9AJ65_9BACT|nr:hypothetical protein [Hymenobacter sp. M29]MDO7849006.1 hypothetical protein [Hymenobacter sp. M29]